MSNTASENSQTQTGLFCGRSQIAYGYGCFGWTRGGGSTWHGGSDEIGLDDKTIRMPFYCGAGSDAKKICGTVVTARIVTDRSNKTWEWGYYVCVKLDANQTPDGANYLYFCHCAALLVKAGDRVSSGDALAIMGNSGNAAQNDPPYSHCHFEVRATATGTGLAPIAYTGHANAVGVYGTKAEDKPASKEVSNDTMNTIQLVTIAPLTNDQVRQTDTLAESLGLVDSEHYKVQRVDNNHFAVSATVSNGDALKFLCLTEKNGWDKLERYHSRFVL